MPGNSRRVVQNMDHQVGHKVNEMLETKSEPSQPFDRSGAAAEAERRARRFLAFSLFNTFLTVISLVLVISGAPAVEATTTSFSTLVMLVTGCLPASSATLAVFAAIWAQRAWAVGLYLRLPADRFPAI